jgi:hypothetical protein
MSRKPFHTVDNDTSLIVIWGNRMYGGYSKLLLMYNLLSIVGITSL